MSMKELEEACLRWSKLAETYGVAWDEAVKAAEAFRKMLPPLPVACVKWLEAPWWCRWWYHLRWKLWRRQERKRMGFYWKGYKEGDRERRKM